MIGWVAAVGLAAFLAAPGCSTAERDSAPVRTTSSASSKDSSSPSSEAPAAESGEGNEAQSSPRLGSFTGDGRLDGAVAVAAPPHEIIPLAHEIMIELGMRLGLSNMNIREGAAVGYDDLGNEVHVLAVRTGEASSMMRVELADESSSPICEDIRDLILARTGP